VAVPFTSTLFLVALLTVLIVLFDRYHTVHRARLLVLEASGGQA
jgi:hypothetical protein